MFGLLNDCCIAYLVELSLPSWCSRHLVFLSCFFCKGKVKRLLKLSVSRAPFRVLLLHIQSFFFVRRELKYFILLSPLQLSSDKNHKTCFIHRSIISYFRYSC